MKLFLSLLSFCLAASGQEFGNQPFLSRAVSTTAAEVFTFGPENVEAIGSGAAGFDMPNWVLAGSTAPNPNSTTVVLQGAKTLRMADTGTDASVTNVVVGSRLISVSWMQNLVSYASSTRDGLSFFNSAGTRIWRCRLDGNSAGNRGTFLFSGGSTLSGTLGDWPTNSATKIWVDLDFGSVPGVSTDCKMNIFWITNATVATLRPATTNLTLSGSTSLLSAGNFGIQFVCEQVTTDYDFIRYQTNALILN